MGVYPQTLTPITLVYELCFFLLVFHETDIATAAVDNNSKVDQGVETNAVEIFDNSDEDNDDGNSDEEKTAPKPLHAATTTTQHKHATHTREEGKSRRREVSALLESLSKNETVSGKKLRKDY